MKLRLAIVVCCLMLAITAFASAQMQFSADTIIKSPKMGQSLGKMYFGGTKMRMDTTQGGHSSIMIVDLPRKMAAVLMPEQRMYMEMDYAAYSRQMPDVRAYDPAHPCNLEPGVTCRKIGTEMVNGRMCDKWAFTGGSSGKRTVWIDQRNHLPIRTLTADGTLIEFTNVKEGPQPASLFQIPPGYRKMDMGGMMQGMPASR
ncbi:MAG: DUF4412 domain-containing protein [Terriglobales bacterium]